jgi:hypothetical protein
MVINLEKENVMTMKIWTSAEQRAIAANPDLPKSIAAAFADDLNEMADETGVASFSKMLGVPDGEGFPPAEPGSIQKICPHLRNPSYL